MLYSCLLIEDAAIIYCESAIIVINVEIYHIDSFLRENVVCANLTNFFLHRGGFVKNFVNETANDV